MLRISLHRSTIAACASVPRGASGNLAATRFQLRYAASRYDFSPDNNLC